MLYTPRFTLRTFAVLPDEAKREALVFLLEALVRIDELWLRNHPNTPELYASGVRYEAEPIGTDDWRDIPQIIAYGNGDCEDLGCWRVAELRSSGEAARPWVKRTQVNRQHIVYHVQVQRGDGTIEDPSRILGMKSVT